MASKLPSEAPLKEDSTHHPFKFCLRSNYLKLHAGEKNSHNTILKEKQNRCNEFLIHSKRDHSLENQLKTNVTNSSQSQNSSEKTSESSKNTATQTATGFIVAENYKETPSNKNPPKDNFNEKDKDSENANKVSNKSFSSSFLKAKSKSLTKNSMRHTNIPQLESSKIKTKTKPPQTSSTPIWKSFTSKSSNINSASKALCRQTTAFSYDLSTDELRAMNNFERAMKPTSEYEQHLLKTGSRSEYLRQRYLTSPDNKYNYPEATSWRIGWLHRA
ncbi:uncharacterized protein LOC106094148 [Stomoxys calcitrans]|uniref:uncharacterized protein LOC106094148 n=1 Tax=Stomoxys calcitrans TaxID=35570 RepID=UPI0027E2C83E|nr:uncharacterized protein LOC106094148 [Stomoxys calcitrans]